MSLPPATDFFALLGIGLVLCAMGVRLLGRLQPHRPWLKGACAVGFILLWIPAGEAGLPLLAYVRGITSDFSVTTVVLAVFSLSVSVFGAKPFSAREMTAVHLS